MNMNIKDIEAEIEKISQKEGLFSLANFKEVTFDGENALSFLSRIRETRKQLNDDGKFDLMTHDLINSVSSDIKFALANAYIYFPHTNNFLEEIQTYPDGRQQPTFFMNLEDKRFFFYINTCFEKLYIFWDRIGDILSQAQNLDMDENRVYFSNTVQALRDQLSLTESGRWLYSFYEDEYNQILNRLRIKIVHYRQKDSYFYTEWLRLASNYNGNPEDIAKLQREKEDLLPLLKNQLELANAGFEKMVRFIAEQGYYEK